MLRPEALIFAGIGPFCRLFLLQFTDYCFNITVDDVNNAFIELINRVDLEGSQYRV